MNYQMIKALCTDANNAARNGDNLIAARFVAMCFTRYSAAPVDVTENCTKEAIRAYNDNHAEVRKG